jgi:ribosomal protein S14
MKPRKQDVEPSVAVDDAENNNDQRRKRLKTNDMKRVCVICGSDRKTVRQQKVHKLLRICEKQIAQKLLNAAKLLQDRVYTETAAMCGPEDVFAADIYYHSYCCKEYFNKYNLKIVEIMKSL